MRYLLFTIYFVLLTYLLTYSLAVLVVIANLQEFGENHTELTKVFNKMPNGVK